MAKKETKAIEPKKTFDLTTVIATAIQIPGVKVNRETFLREVFEDYDADWITEIVEKGLLKRG